MADASPPIEIPKRPLFRAMEVCELVKVQPYVLRSWEGEFPGLGVAKTAGGPRVYRRSDIERVIRIKHLLLVEGLTLAGARRKLEEEDAPTALVDDSLDPEVRDRLTEIKRGLRAILDLLSAPESGESEGFELRPPPTPSSPVQSPPDELPLEPPSSPATSPAAHPTGAPGGPNALQRPPARRKRSAS
jgi:DNA-binding transcriptional MerR regulator